MSLGAPELILILVIVLLLFGPSKLPGLGKSVGEAIRGFKKGINEDGEKTAVNSQLNHESKSEDQNSKVNSETKKS